MTSRRSPLVSVSLILLAIKVASPSVVAAPPEGYHLLKKVRLGGESFWDYLKLDPDARRLYISRGSHVMVVDADTYNVGGDIPNTPGVHGIALAPEFGRGFTSDGGTNQVTIFDLKTLRALGAVKTGEAPDAIIYDPVPKRVFTFNGRTGTSTAVDGATGNVAGTIELGGRPEFAAADREGHVYNNLEDKSIVLQIDPKNLKVLNRWPLAPCESPSGMAIHRDHRLLFVGCRNKMMAVVDADSGRVVATVPIGQGVDSNRFDPAPELVFSSNSDGTLTVVHEDSAEKYTVVENVQTQRGARTMTLDPKTHRVYLVTAEFGPMPRAQPGQGFRRLPLVPGSFTLLVFTL